MIPALFLVFSAMALDPAVLPAQRLGLRLGFDPAPELGVTGTWALPVKDRAVTLGVELALPVFLLGSLNTAGLTASASMPVLAGPWDVRPVLALSAQALDDGVSREASLLVAVSAVPGWYGEKLTLGLPICYRWGFLSHFTPSDAYLEDVPTAEAGWYGNTSRYLYVAGLVDRRLGERWDIALELGYRIPGDFGAYAPYLIPFGVNLALGWRWGAVGEGS